MLGHWKGTGTRSYPISGRQVEVSEDVLTISQAIHGEDAAFSRDQVTETAPGAAPRSYVTEYWVSPTAGHPGCYALGGASDQGPGPASAIGLLGSDGVFRVDQNLGNGYLVHSETRFEAGETLYTEIFKSGDEVQSRTEIRYTQITQGITPQNR